MGFIRVANESMCRPIRELTQVKGRDTSRHVLACFGGAGGQHACAIARSLGIKVVLIHRYSRTLSAYGIILADVAHEEQEAFGKVYDTHNFAYIDERLTRLSQNCVEQLKQRGFTDEQIHTEPYLHMRYDRADYALLCGPEEGTESPLHAEDFLGSRIRGSIPDFAEKYLTEIGFIIKDLPVI